MKLLLQIVNTEMCNLHKENVGIDLKLYAIT